MKPTQVNKNRCDKQSISARVLWCIWNEITASYWINSMQVIFYKWILRIKLCISLHIIDRGFCLGQYVAKPTTPTKNKKQQQIIEQIKNVGKFHSTWNPMRDPKNLIVISCNSFCKWISVVLRVRKHTSFEFVQCFFFLSLNLKPKLVSAQWIYRVWCHSCDKPCI